MADEHKTFMVCPACDGTLFVGRTQSPSLPGDPSPMVSVSCAVCAATPGYVEFGALSYELVGLIESIKTKVNNIEADTNKIWAKVKDL
jgi:RNase P subunit RPR2